MTLAIAILRVLNAIWDHGKQAGVGETRAETTDTADDIVQLDAVWVDQTAEVSTNDQ